MCARRFKFESNRNPPAWWFDHRVCPLNPLPHVCVADRFGPDWCYPNSPQGSNYGLPALQHELGLRQEQHRYSAVAILAPGRSAAIDALAAPPCGGERAVSQRNRTFVPQWHTFCHNTSAPAALQLIAEMWLAAHACPLLLNAAVPDPGTTQPCLRRGTVQRLDAVHQNLKLLEPCVRIGGALLPQRVLERTVRALSK